MLVIRAVSFKGRAVGQGMVGHFGEAGGTIGRGAGNTLVLPDPERYISRTHVTVSYQAGGFVLTDNGAKNPVILNGRPLGPGTQTRLSDGDQIQIGDYALEVALSVPSGSRNALADPFAVPPVPEPRHRAEQALPVPPVASAAPGPAPPDPFAGLRGPEPNIDELFDLKPARNQDLIPVDPFPRGSTARPERPGTVDPLELFGAPARPVQKPSVPDRGEEIYTPFVPPAPRREVQAGEAPGPREILPPEADPRLTPPARKGGAAQDVGGPEIPAAAGAPPAAEQEMFAPETARPAPPPPVAEPEHAQRRASSGRATPSPERPAPDLAAADASREALVQAFLRGTGIAPGRFQGGLTPERMETIGKLLREAVQGTLDLLRGRAMTKSEMRADMTLIMPIDNNPLKFSPTAEAALAHLLGPHVPGYLPPDRAMKDAYDDLRAHQLGFLAGMRAALDDVLARFEPEQLEERLSDPGMLASLLPMNRKGKLWDLFVEQYTDVAGEARDDFNAAFGKAFLQAYEAQVKRLRSEERRGP